MTNAEPHPRFVEGAFRQVTLEVARAHTMATAYSEAMSDLMETRHILEQANNELEEQLAAKEVLLCKLRDTRKQATAATRAKAAFLSHMSHELRTPLTGVLGLAEMMQMKIYGPFGDPRYESYLEDILESSRYLLQHLDNMLEVSSIELEESNIDIGNLNLRRVMAHALPPVARNAKKKNIRLKTIIPRNLPMLWADEAWVEQILRSLIENAIKFSAVGTKVVLAACKEDAERVAISISDRGPGMSQEEVEAALVLFGAADPMRARRDRGLGIGLSTSRRLVEVLGGTLNIDTAPGQGTIVTVRLPSVDCGQSENAA